VSSRGPSGWCGCCCCRRRTAGRLGGRAARRCCLRPCTGPAAWVARRSCQLAVCLPAAAGCVGSGCISTHTLRAARAGSSVVGAGAACSVRRTRRGAAGACCRLWVDPPWADAARAAISGACPTGARPTAAAGCEEAAVDHKADVQPQRFQGPPALRAAPRRRQGSSRWVQGCCSILRRLFSTSFIQPPDLEAKDAGGGVRRAARRLRGGLHGGDICCLRAGQAVEGAAATGMPTPVHARIATALAGSEQRVLRSQRNFTCAAGPSLAVPSPGGRRAAIMPLPHA